MEFNSKHWKTRAWDRYTRAIRRKSKNKTDSILAAKWSDEVLAIADLEKLVKWCADHRIVVHFQKKAGGVYYPDDKQVVISNRMSPRTQEAYLIHECGHHLIGQKEHHDRFGMGYPQTSPIIQRQFIHRIACLEEELEAWYRGWKLVKRLHLSITRSAFDDVRLDCIRSYVKWSLKHSKSDLEDIEDD
jgi:hypothetical protein